MSLSPGESVALVGLTVLALVGSGGFAAVADHDYRLRHTETTVSVGTQDPARDFERLDARELQLFHEATESEQYVSDEPFEFPDRVRRNDTYYEFQYTRFLDWTSPSTVSPAVACLGGLLGVVVLLLRATR